MHDAMIDRVAQAMTADDPSAGLADRVRSAIDASAIDAPRPGAWPRWLAAAAAVTLVAGAWWSSRLVDTTLPAVAPVELGLRAALPSPPPVLPQSLDAGVARTPRASTGPRAAIAPRASELAVADPDEAALAAWQSRAIPALNPIAALDLDPVPTLEIQPVPVALPLLTIAPLPSRQLALTPLGAGGAGASRDSGR